MYNFVPPSKSRSDSDDARRGLLISISMLENIGPRAREIDAWKLSPGHFYSQLMKVGKSETLFVVLQDRHSKDERGLCS